MEDWMPGSVDMVKSSVAGGSEGRLGPSRS